MHKPLWISLRDALCTPATRAFFRAGAKAGLTLGKRVHGYVYARWPALYIGVLMGRHPLAQPLVWLEARLRRLGLVSPETYARFVEGYHGKVLHPGAARQLVQVNRPIAATLPEKVLPYSRARDIILEEGAAVALMQCPCRVSKKQHCTPVDVCIVVGDVMVDFVLTHHGDKARRVTPEEALEVIRQEQRRGHAAHAFFKDAVLDRFYTICNCCSCCCAAIESHRNGTPTLASSGYIATLDAARCTGCGLCARRCPFGAIAVRQTTGQTDETVGETAGNTARQTTDQTADAAACDGETSRVNATANASATAARATAPHATASASATAHVDATACMGCGVCTFNCPAGALRLEAAPQRGEPLTLPPDAAP